MSPFAHRSLLRMLFVFALLALPNLLPRASAEPVRRPARPFPDRMEIPIAPAAAARLSSPAAHAPTFDSHTQATVNQYLGQNNWEISLTFSGGYRQFTHPANDLYPSARRGNLDVVWAANRVDNQYDIYLGSYSDSQVVRLTNHPGRDSYPQWSRDGQWIAFESNRAGQNDVYVMDQHGNNLRRLTNSPAYDGMPAWSPDGARLAFISNRSGDYRIHIMNADGSNVSPPINTTSLSANPQWSPDGTLIAYDGDDDGDGWSDLMLINSDGTNQRVLRNYGFEYDALASGWSPDQNQVLFTLVDYVYYQSQLYIEAMRAWAYTLSNGQVEALSYPGFLIAEMEMQTIDTEPPRTTLRPMLSYAQPSPFGFLWPKNPDEQVFYDVQYRRGPTADWQFLVQRQTTPNAALFPDAQFGETVDFRIRGWDAVYNVEQWSPDPQGSTTFVNQPFRGAVTDNRGGALVGVGHGLTPAPATDVATDGAGRFATHTVSTQAHSWQPQAASFGVFPPMQFTADTLPHSTAYLPPADNLLTNSSFETTSAWSLNGGRRLPAAAHTGVFGLRLGLDCGTQCLASSPLGMPSQGGVFRIDAQGTQHIIGSGDGVRHYYKPAGSSVWYRETLATGSTGFRPQFEIAADGTLHVLYMKRSPVPDTPVYMTKAPGGAWVTHEQPVVGGVLKASALSPSGRPAVLFSRGGEWLLQEYVNGRWQTTPFVALPSANLSPPTLLWDEQDRLHMVTDEWEFVGVGYPLLHAVRPLQGHWSPAYHVGFLSPIGLAAVDGNGELHVMSGDRGIYVHRRLDGALASPPVTVPLQAGLGDLVVDDAGRAVVTGSTTVMTLAPGANAWTTWGYTEGWIHRLYVARNGAPFVLGESSSELFLTQLLTATQATTFGATQLVTIPAELPNPTLSWMQRGIGDWATDQTRLRVSIGDTHYDMPAVGVKWEQAWLDLSAWAGQTVPITFAVEQAAGDTILQVDIDDVSLGSGHANSWVALRTATDHVLAGEQVEGALQFGVRTDLALTDAVVTLQLPEGVRPIATTPPAVQDGDTLRWEFAQVAGPGSNTLAFRLQLDQTLPMGTQLRLLARLTHANFEPVSADNQAEQVWFYGARRLLPVLMRP